MVHEKAFIHYCTHSGCNEIAAMMEHVVRLDSEKMGSIYNPPYIQNGTVLPLK